MRQFLALTVTSLASLLMGGCAATCNKQSCCDHCGQKVCSLEVSRETEKVAAFDVEAKDICIPPVRFPWTDCCERQCGEIRSVCVLKDAEKEKDVCKYKWSVKHVCVPCQ